MATDNAMESAAIGVMWVRLMSDMLRATKARRLLFRRCSRVFCRGSEAVTSRRTLARHHISDPPPFQGGVGVSKRLTC
jgi:hypothetical protein